MILYYFVNSVLYVVILSICLAIYYTFLKNNNKTFCKYNKKYYFAKDYKSLNLKIVKIHLFVNNSLKIDE